MRGVMLKDKVVKGSVWSFIGSVGYQIVNLGIFIALSWMLDARDFGAVAMAMVFVEFVVIVARLGLVEALIQTPNLSEAQKNSAFWGALCVAILGTGLLLGGADMVAKWLKNELLVTLIFVLAVLPVLSGLSIVPEALLQREHDFKHLTLRTLVATTISGVVGLVVVFMGYGVMGLVVQRLTSEGLKTLLLWRYAAWKPCVTMNCGVFLSLLKLGVPLAMTRIVIGLSEKFRDFMIGYFLGAAALGYVKITAKLFDFVVQILLSPIVNVALATFSRVSEEPARLQKYYLKFVQIACVLALPAFLGLMVVAEEAIGVVFGEKWQATIPLLQILCLSGVAVVFNYFYTPLLTALGKGKLVLKTSLVAVALHTKILFDTVPYGLEVVYWGNLAVVAVMTLVYLRIVQQSLGFAWKQWCVQLLPPLFSACVMVVVVWGMGTLFDSSWALWILLVMKILLGVAVYAVMMGGVFRHYSQQMVVEIVPLLSGKMSWLKRFEMPRKE